MPRKRSHLESWLGGGKLRVGLPNEWSFAEKSLTFGPDRGGTYTVAREPGGIIVRPIPPEMVLRRLWHLNVCDVEGEWNRLRRVTPFTLKSDTLRTSSGLLHRMLQLLVERGAEGEFYDLRQLTPESREPDAEAAEAVFQRNPVLHSALLNNERGVLRYSRPEWREATFRNLLAMFPRALVGVVVPSKLDMDFVESIFEETGRKAHADEYGELDESKTLGIVGYSKHFYGVPHRPLDIVVYWRGEELLHRQGQVPVLLNRGFPNRVYAFLNEVLKLDEQELQQLEFYVGPLVWDSGPVEHGWTKGTFRCAGWPKRPPRMSDAKRRLWTSVSVRDEALSLARRLHDGESIDDLYDVNGRRRCRLPKSAGRRVAIVCESSKTARLLAEAAPQYRLLVPDESRRAADPDQPAIIADLCLNRVQFDYDTVVSIGVSAESLALKQALAHAKALRSVASPPDAFTFLEPIALQ